MLNCQKEGNFGLLAEIFGIGATIRIGPEMNRLPYAGLFFYEETFSVTEVYVSDRNPEESVGATIRIGPEMHCLPYAGFFSMKRLFQLQKCMSLTETLKRVVPVKETCFCDRNIFVNEISFSFFLTKNCFRNKHTIFWDFIYDF